MSPNTDAADLILHVDAGEEADTEELDQLTRQLLGELHELEIESANLVSDDELPEGAKSAEAVTLGVLAVAVLPTVIPSWSSSCKPGQCAAKIAQ